MKITKKIQALLLAAILAGFMAACGGSQETTLTGADQDAVLAYSEAKTDNLVAAMNANDYAAFSKDFDQAMLKSMPETAFRKFISDSDSMYGAYVSRKVNKVTQVGKYVAVVYDAVFEKQGAVTMRVVFRVDDPHQISGLWFR